MSFKIMDATTKEYTENNRWNFAGWHTTIVWNKVVRWMGQDEQWRYMDGFDQYKKYLGDMVVDFFDNHLSEVMYTSGKVGMMDPSKCRFVVNAPEFEIGDHGYLHVHLNLYARFPRMGGGRNGFLVRPLIEPSYFHMVFRQVVNTGWDSAKQEYRIKSMIRFNNINTSEKRTEEYNRKTQAIENLKEWPISIQSFLPIEKLDYT